MHSAVGWEGSQQHPPSPWLPQHRPPQLPPQPGWVPMPGPHLPASLLRLEQNERNCWARVNQYESKALEDNRYNMLQNTNHHNSYRKKRRAIMLTLGAEAWSWPIPLICSGLFFANSVLVSSRLQGGKFLAREWRLLVWSLSTCEASKRELNTFDVLYKKDASLQTLLLLSRHNSKNQQQ